MLQEAKDLQNEAVDKLLRKHKQQSTFKAPTGSGKTYMMAKFMNEVLANESNVVFLVSSLSKGSLGKQNYEKFMEYKHTSFRNLEPYFISTESSGEEEIYINTDCNVYILETAKSSKSGKLMRGPLQKFFKKMTEGPLFMGLGKKIYLIKDECHIKTNNIDDMGEYFTRVYNFSATPNLARGQRPDVEITNAQAEHAKLIKHVEYDTESNLEDAFDKFKTIKENYRNLLGVNPCLIIQISNKNKADEELEQVFECLRKTEYQDLKWALIVGDKNQCDTNDLMKAKKLPVEKWRKYCKNKDSLIDIIIFKLTISEGWDIPRACMLYQIRDTQSEQLDEQVLGRIRRNPRLLDFESLSPEAQDLAMTAWAYGEEPKSSSASVRVDIKRGVQDEIKIKTTRLKPFHMENDFDIESFLNDIDDTAIAKSIFTLKDEYNKAPEEVKALGKQYITSIQRWYKFVNNLDAIIKKYNEYICDYESTMELAKDENGDELTVSFPDYSFFLESDFSRKYDNWVWYRYDRKKDFFFDSSAEAKFADILSKLIESSKTEGSAIKQIVGGYLFGKNFSDNSDICFEYFLNGAKHKSYPDFVMKDRFNRVHIFEVKSVNVANDSTIDASEYNEKIKELRRCYQQASVLTENIFYLPVLDGDEWKIDRYVNGVHDTIALFQMLEDIRLGV